MTSVDKIKKNQFLQDVQFELDKMKKMLSNERLLKQQAVNKLAEIMNRKDYNKKDRKAASNATSAGYIFFVIENLVKECYATH